MNNERNILFPAEWHTQSGVQLTWPHEDTDWCDMLDEVTDCFVEIATAIAKHEMVLIVCSKKNSTKANIAHRLPNKNITYFECDTNDTWARDHAPISIFDNDKPAILDFAFNGWGMKFASHLDNKITKQLYNSSIFAKTVDYRNCLNTVFEGGSIESDGNGLLLTTAECLLSMNRNGEWNRQDWDNYFTQQLGAIKILWLNHGFLAGDDTDSHVDTLARLCPNNTILYVQCNNQDDIHYSALKAMEMELQQFSNLEGKPFDLIPLPMASPQYFENHRIPATYANFLIINHAVLVPIYNDAKNDALAIKAVQKAFPTHEIIGINCIPLIKQHGSLHCVTMQYPEGFLNF